MNNWIVFLLGLILGVGLHQAYLTHKPKLLHGYCQAQLVEWDKVGPRTYEPREIIRSGFIKDGTCILEEIGGKIETK